ncbi:MAG: hypothetical protein EBS27_03110 [Actinobacteria bacterium]|nr:hypothetical protein [Actinomycetota bacterium]
MSNSKFISRSVVLSALVAMLVAVAPAQVSAAVGVSVNKTEKLADLEVVSIKLANVPAGQGVYISQCFKPTLGQRAATGLICNGSVTETGTMIWATTDGQRGSQSATGELVLMMRSSFSKIDANGESKTYDCGVSNCSLFVYRDHRGITDTALDTIVPLKFLPRQTVALAKLGLKRDGASYKAGESVVLSANKLISSKGQKVVVTSDETRSICTTTGTTSVTIKFRKAGTCRVTLFADGSSKFDQMIEVLTYTVK